MHDVKLILAQMRKELYSLKTPTNEMDTISSFSKLQNISDDLRELIVLIYSNNKTEIQLLQHNHFQHNINMIDLMLKIINTVETLVDENISQKSKPFSLKQKLGMSAGSFILIFVILLGADVVFPDQTKRTLDFFTSVFKSKTEISVSK